MKKVLLASVVLTAFSLAIIAFQLSCQKSTYAQVANYTLPPATTSTLGGVIIGSGLSVSSNGTLSVDSSSTTSAVNTIVFLKYINSGGNFTAQIWTSNYDGTNQKQVVVSLPTGISITAGSADGAEVKLSPDGKTIFFLAQDATQTAYIYSCTVSGSTVTKVVDGSGTAGLCL